MPLGYNIKRKQNMGLVHTKTYVKGSHQMLQPKVAAQVEIYKTQSRLSGSSSTSFHTHRQQTAILQPISPNFKDKLSDKYPIEFQTDKFQEERKSAFKPKKETKADIRIQNKGENKIEIPNHHDIKMEKKKGDSISIMINEENYDQVKFMPRKLQKNSMEFVFN